MKKALKRLGLLLVFLILALLLCYQWILRTASGSRWAVEFATSQWLPELSIKNITGTLKKGLVFKQLQYQDDSIEATVAEVSTGELSLAYFSPKIILSHLAIKGVQVMQKDSGQHSNEPLDWQGLSLPFDAELLNLSAKDVSIQSTGEDAVTLDLLTLDSLALGLGLKDDVWSISNLSLENKALKLSADAQVESNQALDMELKANAQWAQDGKNWQAQVNVQGSVESLSGQVTQSYQDQQLVGDLSTSFQINNLLNNAQFDTASQVIDAQLIDQQGKTWRLDAPEILAKGYLDVYQLSGNVSVQSEHNELLENIQLLWLAQGDLKGLDIESVKLSGALGELSLQGDVAWENGLNLNASMQIENLNPELLFPDWSGDINGEGDVQAEWLDEQQWRIKVPEWQLSGGLKNAPLALNLAGEIVQSNGQGIAADGAVKGHWGNNAIDLVLAQTTENNQPKWSLNGQLNWPELELLNPELSGQINADLSLTHQHNLQNIEATVSANALSFGEHAIESVNAHVSGSETKGFDVLTELSHATLSGQQVQSIVLSGEGLMNEHVLDFNVLTNDLKLKTQVNAAFDAQHNRYAGTVASQELSFTNNEGVWRLEQASTFDWSAESWLVEKACWRHVDAKNQTVADVSENLCFEVKSQRGQALLGQLSLLDFDVTHLASLFPQSLAVEGQLEGGVDLAWQGDDIQVASDINLNDGFLTSQSLEQKQHRIQFNQANLSAQHANGDSKVKLDLATEDGSYLQLSADVGVDDSSQDDFMERLLLDGSFKAHVADNQMIAKLSDEIDNMTGDLMLVGQIIGPIQKPQVSAELSLNDGDLSLKSMAVPLRSVHAQINSNQASEYHYQFNAQGGEGQIQATGALSQQDDKAWRANADVKGVSFLVADGADLMLAVSPDLKVKHHGQMTQVSGTLSIPTARIHVQELPASVVTLSEDVTMVDEISEDNPMLMDVDVITRIESPVALSVLGLSAGLVGELHIKSDDKKQGINAYGQLKLTDGKYEIYGQSLVIKKGMLLFDGPMDNPRLQVRAERLVKAGQVVGIEISGDVDHFKTSLVSEPPLSDAETLSYIVTGHGLSDLKGDEQSGMLADAVLMMGLQQNSELMNGLKNGLGIDVLTVSTQADTGATIEAGKNLGEKIFVGYNQGIFKHIGYWLLRYQINDKLSLETKQGEEQSVDLVYRREKK